MIDKFENNRSLRKFIAQVENKTCFNWNENIVGNVCFEISGTDIEYLMKQAQKLGSSLDFNAQYFMKQYTGNRLTKLSLKFDLDNDWKQLYKDIKNNLED